jgi:SNF2 family DNA or RNA helicase
VFQAKDRDSSLIQNTTMTLRQICSGFTTTSGKRIKGHNAKLNALWDLLDSIVDSHKAVIFHEFIVEGLMIEELLNKKGVLYNKLNGSVKDKHYQYKTFQDSDKTRVMVAHPLSGGSSIDLYAASYCVFFSNGYKVIDRLQCEKRIHRSGQQSSRVFYYDLMANGTVEVSIHKRLMGKLDVFSKIMSTEAELKNFLSGRV